MKKRRLFPFAIISLLLILAFLNFTSPKNAEKINTKAIKSPVYVSFFVDNLFMSPPIFISTFFYHKLII